MKSAPVAIPIASQIHSCGAVDKPLIVNLSLITTSAPKNPIPVIAPAETRYISLVNSRFGILITHS